MRMRSQKDEFVCSGAEGEASERLRKREKSRRPWSSHCGPCERGMHISSVKRLGSTLSFISLTPTREGGFLFPRISKVVAQTRRDIGDVGYKSYA